MFTGRRGAHGNYGHRGPTDVTAEHGIRVPCGAGKSAGATRPTAVVDGAGSIRARAPSSSHPCENGSASPRQVAPRPLGRRRRRRRFEGVKRKPPVVAPGRDAPRLVHVVVRTRFGSTMTVFDFLKQFSRVSHGECLGQFEKYFLLEVFLFSAVSVRSNCLSDFPI